MPIKSVSIERSAILAHPTRDPLYTPTKYVNLTAYYVPAAHPASDGRLVIVGVEMRSISVPRVFFDSLFQSPDDNQETFQRELNRVFSNCQTTIYTEWGIGAKPTTSHT